MTPLEVQLIIALAQIGAPMLSALFGQLRQLLAEGHESETLQEVTTDIVDGINRDHPDWSDEKRAQWAADAIAVEVRRRSREAQ